MSKSKLEKELCVDLKSARKHLLHFLAIEGITGQEAAIAAGIADSLRNVGVPAGSIRFDSVHKRIPVPTETGNLIVDLPGTLPGPRLMFMTHMDTVPLCAGAVPRLKGRTIVSAGPTALGGDNRTGCGVLVSLAETLIKSKTPHPPLTLFFTVREESGLYGARFVNLKDLSNPTICFNVDGRSASDITIGAVGAERWDVIITGKAAHAGVHPERGVSATMIASLALSEVYKNGWFGSVVKGKRCGTSNVGIFGTQQGLAAGNATNVVTDHVFIRGESRSHNAAFAHQITKAYQSAFERAARSLKNQEKQCGSVQFEYQNDYYPFLLAKDEPVIERACQAVRAIEREPVLRVTNGGLDANWLVKHGIPTVTFGAGQNEIHTVNEWVDLEEYDYGCLLAAALVRGS